MIVEHQDERRHLGNDQWIEVAPAENAPRFSVVVPAFNESACVADCLRSLANQDFAGTYEVIVVDNNSTDRTAAIARSLGATVVHEERPGVCAARQAGTALARGEIVVSTDADTTFDPTWLSRIDRAFSRHPACVAVAGPCRFAKGRPLWGALYPHLLFGLVALVRLVTGRVFYVTATNIAFRKGAWSGYDTRLTQGGDELDLLRRLQAKGKVVFDIGNPTFTSPRRLNQGLLYNIVVTFLFYYLLAYWLNRLLGRPILGTAPTFRHDTGSGRFRQRLGRMVAASTAVVMFVLLVRTGLDRVDIA